MKEPNLLTDSLNQTRKRDKELSLSIHAGSVSRKDFMSKKDLELRTKILLLRQESLDTYGEFNEETIDLIANDIRKAHGQTMGMAFMLMVIGILLMVILIGVPLFLVGLVLFFVALSKRKKDPEKYRLALLEELAARRAEDA